MNRWNIRISNQALAVLALLLFLAAGSANAATLDEANRAFAEARYSEAAKSYEELIRVRGYSAPLLFNLGNAYFRDGQLGAAILNYERAQLLAPNDPDIAANLKFARKQAGLFVEESSWVREAARFFSLNDWAWIGSVALVLLCAGVVGAQLHPQQRLYLRFFTGTAALIMCAAIAAIALQFDTLDRAVVTSKEAVARISPFDAAKSAFVLSAGEVVEIEKAHGGFLLVENRDERTGWVREEQVEKVVPNA